MPELPEKTESALDFPAQKQTIDEMERRATLQIYEATNKAYRQSVAKVVSETQKEIQSEQLLRFIMPFVEESTRQVGRELLKEQEAAIHHIQAVAAEWRSRVYF